MAANAIELTAEQEQEALRVADIVLARTRAEVVQAARLLVSKPNREFFGATEFQLRDAMHRVGAVTIETALEERKKRGTKVPRSSARTARRTPNSRATTPKP